MLRRHGLAVLVAGMLASCCCCCLLSVCLLSPSSHPSALHPACGLCRCSKLTTLQLVNVHLEHTTIRHIAASCPALQRLCLTDYNAFAASSPVKSVSRVRPVVFNNQQQQQGQGQAAAAGGQAAGAAGQQQQQAAGQAGGAAAGGAAAAGPMAGPVAAAAGAAGFGFMSEVVTTLRPPEPHSSRPELDWTPLASLRCLVQLSLKSSSDHVVSAARQLGLLKHTVKNLKLEAQGLKVAELQQLGEQLVVLPHLTWLALVLQYRPERPKPARSAAAAPRARVGTDGLHAINQQLMLWQHQLVPAPANGGAGAAGQGQGAQQQGLQQVPPAGGAAGAGAAGGGAGAVAGGNNNDLLDLLLGGNGAGAAGAGGLRPGWAWGPAEQLGKTLMHELPGTALELRVRPHSSLF